jgi:predicted nucleotidyltransferase component of viral defense system
VSKVREVARLGEKDRKELFRATAQAMEVHEAIIEKDFWVCWVLDFLFSRSQWKERLAFKGGTSLSKAYAIIERFSEDIDLILDWELLGYSKEPWQNRSITQQNRFSQEANRRAACFLADHRAPT